MASFRAMLCAIGINLAGILGGETGMDLEGLLGARGRYGKGSTLPTGGVLRGADFFA